MIDTVSDLLRAFGDQPEVVGWETKIRVYLNGRYMIEQVRLSEDDGAIVLWLDERGAKNSDYS